MTSVTHSTSSRTESNLLRAKRRMEKLNRQRLRLLPRALALGVLSGLMAVAFAAALDAGEGLRTKFLQFAHQAGSYGGVVLSILFSVITISVAVWLVRFFAPAAAGSGIPHLKGVLLGYRSMVWHRILWVKFISGVIGVTGGLTLGREGPTVQMGGALGQMFGSRSHSDTLEQRILIAAGAGAGLSAIFNAPLAGVVFVLEELQGNFASPVFFAALIASMTADVLSRWLMGQNPVFHVTVTAIPDLASLPLFLALGILAGVLGVLFNRALLATQRLSDVRGPWKLAAKWISWGTIIGLMGWWMPELCGGGHLIVERILGGHEYIDLWTLALLFGLRFVLTMGSYGTGAAGGIFAPLLVLGALLGLIIGELGREWFPLVAPEPLTVAVAGMAAYFTAIVRAPLTGIVLIVEMTGNYSLILPLFTACFSAYVIAEWWPDVPIYEALLERDLEKDTITR
ncbi:MAG TPA: H(+)/Cl(-) exchange transporter ClcA [Candidatus Competibacteraceae bacterium]|nr:H(+)/Cl(-) exchange transporter ClcA [Candidatus Competibacteraceae bacterium]MCP5133439.1 H(+)/Cl(-) exchange transporter ClcA [Gammaproteobacteria bacterium]HPF57168.1 H(+)/Cl(-) exchange transporter ClcA [Candidatus Competibacteraceae bacterium]HRY17610.1 H(+)/Cl(-) exchange transporter ClcA [Candidatus Competibacteraceae bacterium]